MPVGHGEFEVIHCIHNPGHIADILGAGHSDLAADRIGGVAQVGPRAVVGVAAACVFSAQLHRGLSLPVEDDEFFRNRNECLFDHPG